MTPEKLVGGTKKGKRRRRESRAEQPMPILIGPRFLAMVFLCAAFFAGLGLWRVNTVFTIRDHEMETGRLQDLAQKRHDRHQALAARISQLQRAEVLEATALEGLGMAVPEPRQMEKLTIPRDVKERWETAAAEVRRETQRKED